MAYGIMSWFEVCGQPPNVNLLTHGQLQFIAQALCIPFKCLAAAEKNSMYRKVIMANHGSRIEHLYCSIEDMLAQAKRSLPSCQAEGSSSCRISNPSINLGVTGSPCNPYSVQRAKRFHDGNVTQHSMNAITMRSVIEFYCTFEPKTGVTEQVRGFVMRSSTNDATTPCDRLLVYMGGCQNQGPLSTYPRLE